MRDTSPLTIGRETEQLMLVYGSTRRQRHTPVEFPEPLIPPEWEAFADDE